MIPVYDEKVFESLKEEQILENKKHLGIEPEIIELVKKLLLILVIVSLVVLTSKER